MDSQPLTLSYVLWTALGVTGGLIFFSRFYLQWWASERAGRSVMPVSFWYMSSVGAIMLLLYAVHEQSPVGALSFSLNSVIYSRNLIHIWREKGTLTRTKGLAFQGVIGLITVVALVLLALIWRREYEITQAASGKEATETWFWIAIGSVGALLFGSRFLIQWIATELKRKSVVPHIFWHISVVATLLQFACYWHRSEWVYAVGMVTNLFVYIRNIYFNHRGKQMGESDAEMAE
ncbi:MAG: lipid-A-disaccharide synthase N-terminal domain-containing protein [Candidatus Hydrogenedentes bacterium]|nr:lipid-A-disaccharide synthase N-terminal domain-containing protein [Candidatus Hydrogenedentota bacterium]